MTRRRSPRPPVRATPDPEVPAWIRWPVRLLALVFVVPVRLGWAALVAFGRFVLSPVGRFLYRYLLRPLGWFLDRVVWRPLCWLFVNLLWRPLGWLGRYLLVVPIRWLFRVFRPALRAVGRALLAVARWIGRGLRAGWRVVRPGVVLVAAVLWAAVVWAWRAVGVVLGLVYRLLLRPVGLALRWLWRHTVVPVARAVGWLWRATVVPAGCWVRDTIWRPAAATARGVLVALGLRRPDPRSGR
ncbi:hypothetical protein [Polymorphospora lycopeni]|uniref:Uncharacterized protein n=1 Tax=Polymorphospora lycopeni TaxID=3140240 RepID=A0ABV5CS31_9ACTN